jgi:hypothetical protein
VVAAVEVEVQLSASKYICLLLLDENVSILFAQGKTSIVVTEVNTFSSSMRLKQMFMKYNSFSHII